MGNIDEILEFNQGFVQDKEYRYYEAEKFPRKNLMVITCMDARLLELLPQAMNLKNGDVKMIKIAGALISEPYGSVMRSILVGVPLLGIEEILVVGHTDCGMVGLEAQHLLRGLGKQGVTDEQVESLYKKGVDVKKWLRGCTTIEEGVMDSVHLIRNHPIFPSHVPVHGLTIHSTTGKLRLISDGRHYID